MITALALLALAQSAAIDHTFVYRATKTVQRVNVAGSFNGWNKDADPMTLSSDGITWTSHMALNPGSYTYKFVLNGSNWITDPKAQKNVDDGNGNTNSLVLIVPTDYSQPAAKGDGLITASALQHLTEVPFLNFDRGRLTLSLRARRNDIASIQLAVDGKNSIPMTDVGGDEIYERYSANVPWDRKHDVRYAFILNDGDGPKQFGPDGLTALSDSNTYLLKAETFHPFVVPDWVQHSVIYHIFPDRFANGDKSNDPPNVAPWNSEPTLGNYFGGDIAGVEQHLGYLKDLGVSAVFFNPVFKSPVYHRYETADYLKIDPYFGTNEQFAKLTHDLKADGIRTILDGVFNHTATTFAPFADVIKNGAASKYTDWYTFKSFPVKVGPNPNYVAWFNYPSLPKLNYASADARRYMLGIPKFWQAHADVEGWRLDAANEVTPDYWRDFRKTVKAIDHNAWIVGEEWGDASPWLKGDQWDSTMNYQFREAALGFVTKTGSGKPTDLMRKLMSVYSSYAPQISRNMMNLIGSHDTARILTLCDGDRSLSKIAANLQFTWVGTPSIYYGDELGMAGGKDPDNRRGMAWAMATPENDFLSLYRTLIKARNENLPLQSGDPAPILADDSKRVVAFARVLNNQADVIALNRSDKPENIDLNLGSVADLPRTAITVEFTDALSGKNYIPSEGTLHLRLAPRSAAILIPRLGSLNQPSHHLATSKPFAHKEPQ